MGGRGCEVPGRGAAGAVVVIHGAAYVLWLYAVCELYHGDECCCVEMSNPQWQ